MKHAAIALVLVAIAPSAASAPTIHDSKVRAFRALLRITEQAPDAIDATGAEITVGGCRRADTVVRCGGRLAPVWISGIPTPCAYVLIVGPHRVRVVPRGC